MRYTIVLLVMLFPVFAAAQTKQQPVDSLLAENIFKDLLDSWTLGIDSNSSSVDIRVYNKFKSLFDSSATMSDDFNAFYLLDSNGNSGTYKIDDTVKSFDLYAHDAALQVSKLRVDSVAIISKNFKNPASIIFKVRRVVYAEKTRQYVLDGGKYAAALFQKRRNGIDFTDSETNPDVVKNNLIEIISRQDTSIYQFNAENTLLITMFFNNDTVKIKSIETVGKKNIRCLNDDDADAVLNREDSLTEKFGDFTANGRPDYDLDGIPDELNKNDRLVKDKCKTTYGASANHGCPLSYFTTRNQVDGFLGFQLNSAKINLPELNKSGYTDIAGNDAMDVLQSQKGVLKKPGLKAGIYAGGSFTCYFGNKKKQSGISIGITYSKFAPEYELTAPVVYTFRSSDGTDDYRRRVSISSLKEEIGYSVFNFPVLYSFRAHPANKSNWVYNIKAGPSLMLFKSTSNYNAMIDVGGIYQIDPDQNKIVYDTYFDTASTYNVYITSTGINDQNTNPGAVSVFSQLHADTKNYDFVSNKNYLGRKKGLTRSALAFNFTFDIQNKISEELAIKAGIHFMYAPLPEAKTKYKPLDSTTEEFNSIYNSSAKRAYSAFGINMGFVYDF